MEGDDVVIVVGVELLVLLSFLTCLRIGDV